MTALAILDPSLAEQLRENPDGLEGLEVRWAGSDPQAFLAAARRLSPDVLVVNLELIQPDTVSWLQRALDDTGATLALCIYRFATRSVLGSVPQDRARTVKAPLSLARLKMQLMSLVVGDLLRSSREPPSAAAPRASAQADVSRRDPRPAPSNPPQGDPEVKPHRYTEAQLGRLLEVRSSLQCECPNHVAELVQSLRGFEAYSKNCANRDDDDARVHRALYAKTAQARAVMEEALAMLVAHERIEL